MTNNKITFNIQTKSKQIIITTHTLTIQNRKQKHFDILMSGRCLFLIRFKEEEEEEKLFESSNFVVE
jgi:hypothetical protein